MDSLPSALNKEVLLLHQYREVQVHNNNNYCLPNDYFTGLEGY